MYLDVGDIGTTLTSPRIKFSVRIEAQSAPYNDH